MKKILQGFLCALLLIGSQAYAQSQVSGRVTGKDDGLPLAGVSVTTKGTKTGTQTGPDGRYVINVQSGTTLVFSFIGYVTQEASASANLNIALVSAPNQLNDVVVVPFGTAKRETFVGAAGVVTAKDFAQRPISNVSNALTAVSPGVQVGSTNGAPGSGLAIRIRGFGSINASNNPLYIIDGAQNENSIANLNPDDVESISVLKDASSTALYGAKAANGVVIITTKKGRKNNGQLSVRALQGLSYRGVPEYDLMNAYQYYPTEWMALRNSLVTSGISRENANILASGLGTRDALNRQVFNGSNYLDVSQTLGSVIANGVYTQSNNPFSGVASNQIVDVNGNLNPNAVLRYDNMDWTDVIKRVGRRGDYGLNYSGGNDKSDYFVSLGYLNEQGFTIKSDYGRFTGRINVNHQATSWLKTGLNINGAITKSNQANDGTSGSIINPFNFSRSIGPVYPVYAYNAASGAPLFDALGMRVYDTGSLNALGVTSRPVLQGRHILQETLLNDNSFRRNVFGARTYGEISFLKHFKFTANAAVDISNNYSSSYQNPIVGDGSPGGRSSKTYDLSTSYNVQQLLNYDQTFGMHHVTALVGHENYSRKTDQLYGFKTQINAEGNTELINFSTTSSLYSYQDNDKSEGFFGSVNYNQKYLFAASVRRDASSRFARDARWGTFGSVGLGWRIDKEDFLKSVSWIDMLKLRSSYGTTGNYQTLTSGGGISLYPYQSLYDINPNATENGYTQSTLVGNNNLKWEVNKTLDIALEFGMFKNRLTGSFEVYDKRSSNLLFLVPLPVSSGVINTYQNIGTMYNRGVEVNLGGDPVRLKDFVWNINVNAATVKNRITKMPDNQPTIVSGTKRLEVGHGIYDYYLRRYKGVDPADGSALYEPLDGATGTTLRTINGVVYTTAIANAKQDYTGTSAIPDVYGSIVNTFTYKGLSLNIGLNYGLGGQFYDSNYQSLMTQGSVLGSALHVDMLKSWKNPGDITDIPRIDAAGASVTNLYATSDRWLTTASYLTIRNATLSYNVPSKFASKLRIKNVRVFASGENLYQFSARRGLDATQGFTGTNSNVYVPARVLSIGLNASL
ncbi:SusC/RagA family TonB-linked outer membrane protein [Mucilaginibacter galii]|uniref:SusC/RagA family TonB-linked outer membrane protein n=1 Tax=Mucilaginibacter galii TaxID=2005073 RepID=A0A917N111_9SPHI|nr:SusC/RagA family TonB-linked outer membrane protein [Mucilaginibacter galii]GGI49984.1 SusC/RagA family TonB-linked outer membrane protein [Mucilaginibacter galii]